MAKQWLVGGIWAILITANVLMCGRYAAAEESRTPKKLLISEVKIIGNRRMTTEKIKTILHTQPGKTYDSSGVDDDVIRLFRTGQFSNIITSLQEDGCGKVKVGFCVRETPNVVQKVTFLGAKHIKPDDLQNLTGIRSGMPLNPNLNREGCQKIIAKYQEMGRTFTCCALVKGGDLADTEVVYEIIEGPKIKVRDIKFTGNTFVNSARLATQIKSSQHWYHFIGGTYNKQRVDADVDELYKYFRGFGYQDVRIALETQRSADGGEITLIFHIQEGPRYRVADKPELHVTKSLRGDHLQEFVKIDKGDYLSEDALREDSKRLKDHCNSVNRFVSVHAIPVWIPDQPGLAKVRYEIEEIQPRIGTIRVSGNKRISSESILAHVPLVPDQVLSYAELKQAEQNLAELGLFVVDAAAGVRPTITVIDGEGDSKRKDLLITVKEKTKAKIKSVERP